MHVNEDTKACAQDAGDVMHISANGYTVFHFVIMCQERKGTFNSTTYNDILDNGLLPALRQQFMFVPFVFQHGNGPTLACTEP